MRRFLAVFVLICGLAVPAEAVTLRDLVGLSKQGLSDDLLIALVEAEKSVFHLTASDVKSLKEQGLSDRLLIHLLQTPELRRTSEAAAATAAERAAPAARPVERIVERVIEAPPQVVVVERVEAVAVPVYIPVQARDDERERRRDRDRDKPATPVYWGYGGKLRPGSWKPGGSR